MLKTNVILNNYKLLVRNKETKQASVIVIKSESLEGAKLKIPNGWDFEKEIK